jgi:hypothetical protein
MELQTPVWPGFILLGAFLPISWLVHSCLPYFFVQRLDLHTVANSWFFSALCALLPLVLFFVLWGFVDSGRIKRGLKDKGIDVREGFWFGPVVQRLMLQEFIDYLENNGLYNPEALSQLIDNTRDEIEAIWRPISVILTVGMLGAAFIIAYYQTVFGQFLQIAANKTVEELEPFALIGCFVLIGIPFICFMLYPSSTVIPTKSSYLSMGRERAIYMHCLSTIRLSLLKHREP